MKIYITVILLGVCAFAGADTIYDYLSTKTAYRFSSNKDVTDVSEEEIESARKIWMFVRHGTRNPSTGDINNMNNRLPDIKDIILSANTYENSVLESDEIELFEVWSSKVEDVAYQQILVAEGELENIEMSQRMQARYPNILPPVFDNNTYLFKTTDSQRTRQSGRNFAIGLFGDENIEDVYFPEPSDEDRVVLEFHDVCSRWQSEIENNPETYIERDLFEETDITREAVRKVNQKIGLVDELSLEDVKIMYKTCAFETSWSRNTSSPWCIPFDLDTIRVLAYAEDIENYFVDGYGFELNYQQACPAFADAINFFEDDETERKATLYFTHSGAVLKLIARLGLFRDEEALLHTNYETNHDRKWRTSKIGNFATNVALILHDFEDSKKVSVRQNEYVVRLPPCPDTDLCDYELVKAYFDESINNCNFDEICGNIKLKNLIV